MVTEEDFQRNLDKRPRDFLLRLVFADWLEEKGDERASGYRALGVHKIRPYKIRTTSDSTWCYHNGYGIDSKGRMHKEHIMPQDWLDLSQQQEDYRLCHKRSMYLNNCLSRCVAPTRKWLEDVAALAFTLLNPERQRELLEGNL